MATDRKFCRFNRVPDESGMVTSEIPEDGFCLSSFLVITGKKKSTVLLGKINLDANWDHIGALDRKRAERFTNGWMLPSSHLILYESPQEAAKRILREQVGIDGLELNGPLVVSEVYENPRLPGRKNHWDIEFIFTARYNKEIKHVPNAWKELSFVDVSKIRKEEITRSHGDIIEYSGVYNWQKQS